ncbi:MAG: NDP-sugar synthase [Myxococcales bacterium]|nr:NDP-sugar synthase [Myxococcales bacterium]
MIRKAMILAAGLGTRLRPLTYSLPKPMVPVALRSMIAYHLDNLSRLGVQEVMINLHHLPDLIPPALQEGKEWGVKLHYSLEHPDILGTGGGIAKVQDFFQKEEAFFLLNGDILHDIDLSALSQAHFDQKAAMTLALRPHPGDPKMGWIGTDEQERVWRVPEMDDNPRTIQKRMFTGLSIISPKVFDHLPNKGFSCVLRAGARGLLEQGERIQGHLDTQSMWVDIGTPASYLQANLDALVDPRFPLHPAIQKQETPKGSVWLAPQAKVDLTTLQASHSLVGTAAQVGAHCELDHVVVWPHATIPANSKLAYGIAYEDQFFALEPNTLRPPQPLHPLP